MLGGPAHRPRLEDRALEDKIGRRLGHPRVEAAHHSRDDQRLLLVGDDEHAAAEGPLLLVEGDDLLAVAGAPNDDLPAGNARRVESMQRLAVLEHHVVGDVDDVVDGAQAYRLEALLDPGRTRAHLDARDDMGRVQGTALRIVDADSGQQVGPRCPGEFTAVGGLGVREVLLEPRSQFPRQTEVREAVGTIGRDLDVDHGVAGGQDIIDGGAHGGPSLEDQESGVVLANPEFPARAHHAVGKLAPDLRLLDDKVAGQDGAHKGHRHAVADLVVLGSADDRLHPARGPHVHRAHGELVGVRVLVAREHLAHDDLREHGGPRLDDSLDLKAEEGDGARHLVHRGVQRDVVPDPVERNLHGRRAQENCFRKRRSF